MKYIFLPFILCLLFLTQAAYSQDFIFFNESTDNTYYDPSFGYANAPSYLELAFNNVKFPVDTVHHFSGTNSLKLHWISKTSGDWGMAVASDGWVGHNIYSKDSLSFMVYSETSIDSSKLPLTFLEDVSNQHTAKVRLANYIDGIKPNTWQSIIIPLSVFEKNPGTANLTKIKTIYFSQGNADSVEHTIYLDDIKMINTIVIDSSGLSAPTGVTASGYDSHIDITWNLNPQKNIKAYYIYKKSANSYAYIGQSPAYLSAYTDFVGGQGITASYEVAAVDSNNNQSKLSLPDSAATHEMTDDEWLTMVQKATFRYFWDYAHPVSGLARERLGSGDIVTMGGSGFGVMAILVGIHRGFITRDQGVQRMLKILNFLTNKADRFHGAFPHWMNGVTGNVIPFSMYDDGGDLVETSFMMEGLLTARQFFNQNDTTESQIRTMITNIWQSVEYKWYTNNTDYVFWHWSPDYDWKMNFRIKGFNETMITYLLGIASPTYSIQWWDYYLGWASDVSYVNGKTFYGYKIFVGPDYGGPLFFTHYSFIGFDPRGIKDKYANYFVNNKNITLVNRAYCINNPKYFAGYGPNVWGLTASDDPSGYSAHSPTNDNGTITPTAALSAMPYTPQESLDALKYMYHKYGAKIWGVFGFKDAFNPQQNWYANSYLSIDEGPIIDMIENYRSQLLWNNFMANPEIQPMLNAIGFKEDPTGVNDKPASVTKFELLGNYPNPFNPTTMIEFSLPSVQNITLNIYDILGRKIKTLINGKLGEGTHQVLWNGEDNLGNHVSSGVYLYTIKADHQLLSGKMILQK